MATALVLWLFQSFFTIRGVENMVDLKQKRSVYDNENRMKRINKT